MVDGWGSQCPAKQLGNGVVVDWSREDGRCRQQHAFVVVISQWKVTPSALGSAACAHKNACTSDLAYCMHALHSSPIACAMQFASCVRTHMHACMLVPCTHGRSSNCALCLQNLPGGPQVCPPPPHTHTHTCMHTHIHACRHAGMRSW